MINRDTPDDKLDESQKLHPSSDETEATGYLHARYSESLSEFGTPRSLSECGGWILERQIPDSNLRDAMGCYPLFSCQRWSQLNADLARVGNSLISLAVVTDPFGEYDAAYLKESFRDLVVPFKEHFVVDLSRRPNSFVSAHHQRNARNALRRIRVEACVNPLDFLEEWTNLYGVLVARHNITGMTVFSHACFEKQLSVPGISMLRAMHNEITVGMLLWYVQNSRAYYHLGAYSELGYELGASFALFSYCLEYFAERGVRWLNLGGGAGLAGDEKSGLNRFKQGWSTGTRTAYFCGRIFDQENYQLLVSTRHAPRTSYFPAYRVSDFV